MATIKEMLWEFVMRKLTLILVALFAFNCVKAQDKKKSLFDNLDNKNYALVSMEAGSESAYTSEIDIIYFSAKDRDTLKYKIHCIVRRNSNINVIDTTFLLNSNQVKTIKEFEKDILNKKFQCYEVLEPGYYTDYKISVGNQVEEMKGEKNGVYEYSLLDWLISPMKKVFVK